MNSRELPNIFIAFILLMISFLFVIVGILCILADVGIFDGWIYTSCLLTDITPISKCIHSFDCGTIQLPRDLPECVSLIYSNTTSLDTNLICTHQDRLCSINFYICDGQLMNLSYNNATLPTIINCEKYTCDSYKPNTYTTCRYNYHNYWPITLNTTLYGFWISMGILLFISALIIGCCGMASLFGNINKLSNLRFP